ncbi:Unknown protein, partial [Striga hermonthica]
SRWWSSALSTVRVLGRAREVCGWRLVQSSRARGSFRECEGAGVHGCGRQWTTLSVSRGNPRGRSAGQQVMRGCYRCRGIFREGASNCVVLARSPSIPRDRDSETVLNIITVLGRYIFNTQMPPRREPDHQELPQATVVAHFRDYHPEKFSGQGDPRIVDEWVQGLEMIFEVMDCPDRYRMLCAQIQLTGDARLWWNAYWSMRPGEKEGCTWDQFKRLIRGKYYPSYYRADMERQFLALRQGTRSVDEYEREFTRIGSFVPDLVSTEEKRAL